MSMLSEIKEQPEVLSRMLASQRPAYEEAAQAIRSRDIRYVFLAARGTSDNAGRYAQYLWGAMNRLPIALATPSLFGLYQQPPRLDGALVVGVSQSGQSPDIVAVLEEGRRQGCLTMAVTNAPQSPLANAADVSIDIAAGKESAVAATKTYTGQLMALAMLSAAMSGREEQWETLYRVPGWAKEVLALETEIGRMAERYRFMEQCVVLGRGYNYATAFEWSLKLKELAYIAAEPYSSADFLHGPIAVIEHGYPVLSIAPGGAVFSGMLDLLRDLRGTRKAELLVISDRPEALQLAQLSIALPSGIPEWVSPMIAILPAQLFCYHLTRLRGLDSEAPRGLTKITETY